MVQYVYIKLGGDFVCWLIKLERLWWMVMFEVSAKDSDQARKFGLSTAMQICKTKGIKSKIQSIDVEEFYEDYN